MCRQSPEAHSPQQSLHEYLAEDLGLAQHEQTDSSGSSESSEAARPRTFLDLPANCISEVSAPTHSLPVLTAAYTHCYLASPAWAMDVLHGGARLC